MVFGLSYMKIPVFCSLLPTELLEGLGHELHFLEADSFSSAPGTACNCSFHENLCSYMKSVHEHLVKDPDAYGIIIIPTSCDAMKKLFNALKDDVPEEKLYLLDVPQNKGGSASRFFASELRKLVQRLGGKIE